MNTTTDSVRIVLFDEADPEKFMILCENDDEDNWKLPGGKFNNADETSAQAAARELKEELGLDSGEAGLREVQELVNDDGSSRRFIFLGQINKSKVHPSQEISKISWSSEKTLPTSKNRNHMLSAVSAARSVL